MISKLEFEGSAEWLEADGLGGYACGTVDLVRTRRYHGVLTVALSPPADRVALVGGFDVWVDTPAGQYALTSQRYAPDVVHPEARDHLAGFSAEPWPTWTYRLPDDTVIVHELTVVRDRPVVLASWRLVSTTAEPGSVELLVRPLLSGRDAHSLHVANESFCFDADEDGELVRWHPYLGLPGVMALSNGAYGHAPVWYHGFLYSNERDLGLECTEDLASPGAFRWDLGKSDAALVLTTDSDDLPAEAAALPLLRELRVAEGRRREALGDRLARSAEAFVVRRGEGRTVLAGYPWSTAWGRDTFVAMRGLCIATERLDDARMVLLEWADQCASGLVPNFFHERPDRPEFNAADASLWFIIAAHEFMEATRAQGRPLSGTECGALRVAVCSILDGYLAGTRFGIRVGDDGLVCAGEPGTPLTWMDARLGDWAVTPRMGKAVEIQALWINALRIASTYSTRWDAILEKASGSFLDRFWYAEGGYLHDVVDVDDRPGTADSTLRPNQILAVGGLPYALIGGELAARVVDVVERTLLTPMGLRTLEPSSPQYVGRCSGNARQTLAAAHAGCAWPWLLGPFVEAWVRVRGGTDAARAAARERFLVPLQRNLEEAGLGHISELADGDAPHTPRGAPFQAWSLGELLRLDRVVLRAGADDEPVAAAAADQQAAPSPATGIRPR
jgi:predicted glycogen debranching enzyme